MFEMGFFCLLSDFFKKFFSNIHLLLQYNDIAREQCCVNKIELAFEIESCLISLGWHNCTTFSEAVKDM